MEDLGHYRIHDLILGKLSDIMPINSVTLSDWLENSFYNGCPKHE